MSATSYRIHVAQELVLFEGVGPISFSEWAECLDRALADPAFRTGFRFLSDRRRMEALGSDREFGKGTAFLRARAARIGPIRWAVLIGSDPADALVRQAAEAAQSSLVQLRSFTDLRAALQWALQVVDDDDLELLLAWVENPP